MPIKTETKSNTPLRRVMQVTWSLVAGGSEMYAYTLVSHLDRQHYSGLICALDKGGALEPEIDRCGIPYFIMHRRDPGIDWKLMWKMYKLFRQHKVDVVQTHHFNQLFYSALAAKLAGARLIHTEHSIEAYKRPRLRIALRWLAFFCDKVIAIGDDGARVLGEQVRIPGSKLEIIRIGVDPQSFARSRRESRLELGLPEDAPIAVIVARLYPEKNHRLLLAAFAEAVRQVENALLLVAGEGIERESIEAEIRRLGLTDHVQMLGVRRDIPRLLSAADVFVLSSDREGLPVSALEAMAAGRPVVATAVGDLPSIVRNRVTGRIVPPGNREALAAALVELLGDPELASAMGENARRHADQQFPIDKTLSRYHEIYSGQL